jgi:hypothetical protein
MIIQSVGMELKKKAFGEVFSCSQRRENQGVTL